MRAAIAMLDRPSSRSFGMLALVVRDEKGLLRTEGLAQPQDHDLSPEDFQELLARGEATALKDEIPLADSSVPHSALWIGGEFERGANSLAVALPPRVTLPKPVGAANGTLWIMRAPHVYHILEVWLQHALRRAIGDMNPATAQLMSWALPDRIETRAALWRSAKSPDSEVQWYLRLLRDRGTPVTAAEVVRRYEDTLREASSAPKKKVVGFTGFAKCGDKEIAEKVAEKRRITHLSFGRWLAKQAKNLGQEETRPFLQELGQKTLESRGALSFCLSVLEDLAPRPQLADKVVTAEFVLESVRHQVVLDAVHFLVGPDRFSFFAAVRPEEERKTLLKAERLQDVEAVMRHSTENEVEALTRQAVVLQSSWGLDAEVDKVLQHVG